MSRQNRADLADVLFLVAALAAIGGCGYLVDKDKEKIQKDAKLRTDAWMSQCEKDGYTKTWCSVACCQWPAPAPEVRR